MPHLRREQSDRGIGANFSYVGLGIHNYHDTFRGFPRDIVSPDGTPLLSWRVAVLPYINESPLYDRLRLDEPWDSEHNRRLLAQMPEAFRSREQTEPTKTSLQWVKGAETAGAARNLEEVKGTNRTVMLVEANSLVEWTRPADFECDRDDPKLGLRQRGSFAVMYDGSRVYLSPSADPALLRAAFSNDGSDVDRVVLDQENPFPRYLPAPEPSPLDASELQELLAALTGQAPAEELEALRRLARAVPDARAKTVLDAVTPLLKSKAPLVRLEAVRAIKTWNTGAAADWRAVAELLHDPYEANRWLAIRILAKFPQPELVAALLRLPPEDFALTIPVLQDNYASFAADAAVPLLSDQDHHVRAAAAFVIGGTGSTEHVAALQGLLQDDHENCREAARQSLARLEQPGPLQAALDEANGDLAAALENLAESVERDVNGNIIGVNLSHHNLPAPLNATDFPLLARLSHLKSLELTYSAITARGVAHLADLPLEVLHLNYCPP